MGVLSFTLLLEQTYTYIGPFQDGVARCAQGGMLNAGMNHAYPIDQLYEYLLAWQSPFILVDDNTYDELLLNKGVVYCEDCTWSYIGPDANPVGKEFFDYAMDMVNQVGMVHRDGKWGLFGDTGDLIIPCAYDDLAFLENTNNRIVKLYVRKTRYGLIDTLGKLTINAVFDEVGAIREGRLAVMKNGKWGFADQDGNNKRIVLEDGAGLACSNKPLFCFSFVLFAVCKASIPSCGGIHHITSAGRCHYIR